jgi:threonine/homoserine/homoserine lactone efflux protein
MDQVAHVGAYVLFVVAAAGTPGPSNLLLTAVGAKVGVWRGLPCLFGVSVGMGAMIFTVSLGLGGVVPADAMALTVARWAGAAFLLVLAWKIATAAPGGAASEPRPVGFLGAALFQTVNPKSWLVCASAAATYLVVAPGRALAQATALGLLFVLCSLPCCFAWLAFGAAAQRLLRNERARRNFNWAMGALLAASVILIVV